VIEERDSADTIDVLPKKKRGRPLLLGDELDKEVQTFVKKQRERSVAITSNVVIAIGKGMVLKQDRDMLAENGGHINLTKHWAYSLLKRMRYVKRRGTTKPRCIPEKFEEIKTQFLQDIYTTFLMEEIPNELIVNWDQTAISILPGSSWTMTQSGTKRVEIAGLGDKRQITAVLGGTLTGDFLPPQLIYTGKTPACHPKNVIFPSDWHITHSCNHWANEETMNDYIKKILVPYLTKVKTMIRCSSTQKALVLFDVFRGQTCQSTLDLLHANNIEFVMIPPNCTDRLQALDISVNKPCKNFI
jgi:hypothetical protein